MQTVTPINLSLRLYDNSHERYWDFSEFEALGQDFVLAFANCFILYATSLARGTAQDYYDIARNLLRFMVRNRASLARLISVLRSDYTKASARDWEDALALWQDAVASRSDIKRRSKHHLRKSLNTLLKRMVNRGVIPAIVYPDTKPKEGKAGRGIPCLAELRPADIKEGSRGMSDGCLSGLKETSAEIEAKEDFLTALLSNTGGVAESTEELAEAMFKLNRERLELLRSCAVKEFHYWAGHIHKGRLLVQECDLEFEEIAAVVDREHLSTHKRSRDLKALFPDTDQDLALARLLKYFADHPMHRGLIFKFPEKLRHPHWYAPLAKRFGGYDVLQAYLFPGPELTTSVITLFLCDTGANVTVARTLPLNCMEDSNERDYRVVRGNKMRASGKIIVNELPVKDPAHTVGCIEALDTYLIISERMRRHAKHNVAERFFLQLQHNGSVRTPTASVWVGWFGAFRNRHPDLKKLNIQSHMIRPSVLLQAVGSPGTELEFAL